MDDKLNSIRDCRARGEILRLIRTRHRAQQSRMDHVELWHMLRGIGIDIGENDAITFLQDLETAQLIKFETEKDRRTNRSWITQIQMCPLGLRVLEGRVHEDMVLL